MQNSLETMGWPKWPPGPIPNYSVPWWKLPERSTSLRFGRAFNKYRPLYELTGPTTAGKSLQSELLHNNKKINPSVLPEAIINIGLGTGVSEVRLPPQLLGEDDIGSFPLEKDAYSAIILQSLKHLWLKYNYNSLLLDANLKTPVIAERAAVDGLIYCYALASYKGPDMKFRMDSIEYVLPNWREQLHELAVDFQGLSIFTTSMIMIGIDQNTALRRSPNGSIANSDFFNHLNNWYGYFIRKIWKDSYLKTLTGLLVLDGEATSAENNKIIVDFINIENAMRQDLAQT